MAAPAHRRSLRFKATAAPAWLLWLGSAALVVGCADDGAKAGSRCTSAAQCLSNFCYANVCLEPGGDDDGDGVLNKSEHAVGAHPLQGDSDRDGKPDGQEWGPGSAAHDGDGDGKPDIVESALGDLDGDCLPDEADADDQKVLADNKKLSDLACSHTGVCSLSPAAITASCVQASLVCNYAAVPGWQAVEACDGVDNDCDGQTDEGFVYQGAAIGQTCSGTGECGKGVVVCAAGKATCSTNPDGSQSRATAEACNGMDDDCDGETDEDFGLGSLTVGAPCLGQGECGIGVVMCLQGQPICSADPSGPHSKATAESCNNRDDDCDGQTDEGMVWGGQALGAACGQLGVCGTGVVTCSAQGQPVCSTSPGQPGSPASAEACNGQDDDCDGVTDEGFTFGGQALGAPCSGVGVCGKGTVSCSASGVATCSTLPDGPANQSGPELCNGKDDDCDGKTDEQLTWAGLGLGAACDGTGSCGPGKVVCGSGGATTCSTNPDGPLSQASAELCNNADDDCDGATDEGAVLPMPSPCTATGVCAVLQPAVDCKAGQWTCDYSGQPGYEPSEASCDSADNDCDGTTDEGLAIEWTATSAWEDGRPVARRGFAVASDPQGRLYASGGLEPSLSGAELLSADLWRLHTQPGPLQGTWQRLTSHPALRRHGAAMLVLDGPGGPATRVALLGGTGSDGLAAPAKILDFSIPVAELPLPPPAMDVTDAVALQLAGEWWLLGTRLDGQGGAVQRFDVQSQSWIAPWPLPPGKPQTFAACAGAGVMYALGVDAAGNSSLASVTPGTPGWQSLPAPPEVASALLRPGRLLCHPGAPELLWVGAATSAGPAPTLRFHLGQQKWLSAAEAAAPALIDPLAGYSDAALVLALGQDANKLAQSHAFIRLPAGWQPLDREPETAVGAAWQAIPGGAVRLGGFEPRGSQLVASRLAWRWLAASGWQRIALPESAVGRGFASALLGNGGTQLLWWGGATAVDSGQLLSPINPLPAPAPLALDLQTLQWSAPPSSVQQQLPAAQVDTAIAATLDPGLWYGLAPSGPGGGAELWRLDWNKGKASVWSSKQGPGPQWLPGTALTYDAQDNRLLAAQASGGLKVWSMQVSATPSWSLAASDPGAPDGRVAWIGGPGLKDRLIAIVPPPGKGNSALRHVKLAGGTLELHPWLGSAPAWQGLVSLAWIGDAAWADGSLASDGHYRSGIERVQRACPKSP